MNRPRRGRDQFPRSSSYESDLDEGLKRTQFNGAGFSYGVSGHSSTPAVKHKTRYKLVFISSSKTVGLQASIIVAASDNRKYLLLQNTSSGTIYLGFGATPDTTGNNAIILPQGAQLDFSSDGIVPNNEIYAISAAANLSLSVLEGVKQIA